jgi:two pore calcium channel protein
MFCRAHLLRSRLPGEIDTFWEALETVFTVVYSLEIICKLLVLGWKSFRESGKNMFDMTITIMAVLATAYVYYPNEFSNSTLIRYVVMARVLRLSRLLTAMRPFQVIANISIEILPMAKNVGLLLFCISYAFAALGTALFGGMISRNPADPLSYLVLNTDFSDNDYWANNFNDMLSGLNVLFNLLVVNNWTECADGFEAVTQSKYTRLFFLAFHIFGVVLVNNLVIAFIVNSFIEQWDKQQERDTREEIEGEAAIEGRRALFDAEYVTGTKTGLAATMFIARIGRRSHNRQTQQALLKNMFTRTESTSESDQSERHPPLAEDAGS